MNGITILLVCSIIVQYVVERLKAVLPFSEKYKKYTTPILALIVGLLTAYSTQVGLFETIGIPLKNIFFDYAITGIAYSGGSAAINELIKSLMEKRPSNTDKGGT